MLVRDKKQNNIINKIIKIFKPFEYPTEPKPTTKIYSIGGNPGPTSAVNKNNNNNVDDKDQKPWLKWFEGNRTIYPIQSRSAKLSTYPKARDINDDNNNTNNNPTPINFAKSSDYVTAQMNQFLVTDDKIISQFPDGKDRKILVSETLYDPVDLWRFVDAYRSDGQVRNTITTMIKYVLGNGRPKIVIDVNDYFSSTDEEQTALEQVLSNNEYKEIARQISKENRRIGFHEVMIACLVDNAIYGRSAAQKVYYDPNKDKIPNSVLKKLGLNPSKDREQFNKEEQKFTNKNGLEILRDSGQQQTTTTRKTPSPPDNNEQQQTDRQGQKDPEQEQQKDKPTDLLTDNKPKKIIRGLKKLDPIRMGKVYYYEDNHELAGVEYLDYEEGRNIVLAEDMIYFSGENMDTAILPRVKYQGFSVIESMIDISETNILNNQTNIKEINRSLWASFLVLKFLSKEPDNLDNFIANYEAGKPLATNADMDAQVTTVGHDLDKLLEQRNNSDMKINRDGQVPDFLAGFPNVNNFATASIEYNAWINSIVRDKRTMLRNVIEPQWIDPIIMDLKGLQSRDELIDLDFKVKLDFENIAIIDPISVNTNPIIQLRNQGFIDEETGLELLGLKYLIPKLQKIRDEKEAQEKAMLDAMRQGQGGYGLRKNPGMSITDKDTFNVKKDGKGSTPSTPDPNAGQDLSAQKGGNKAPIGRGRTPKA